MFTLPVWWLWIHVYDHLYFVGVRCKICLYRLHLYFGKHFLHFHLNICNCTVWFTMTLSIRKKTAKCCLRLVYLIFLMKNCVGHSPVFSSIYNYWVTTLLRQYNSVKTLKFNTCIFKLQKINIQKQVHKISLKTYPMSC